MTAERNIVLSFSLILLILMFIITLEKQLPVDFGKGDKPKCLKLKLSFKISNSKECPFYAEIVSGNEIKCRNGFLFQTKGFL